jgi:hypothetical protein
MTTDDTTAPATPNVPDQDRVPAETADEPTHGYTVIGIRSLDGSLTVAGVVAGEVLLADSDPGPEDTSRWADYFPDADDPDTAEHLAHDQCADT